MTEKRKKPLELVIGLRNWPFVDQKTTALLLLPTRLNATIDAIRAEAELGLRGSADGFESLIGGVLTAIKDGRSLGGWSKWREKERPLTQSEWAEFVARHTKLQLPENALLSIESMQRDMLWLSRFPHLIKVIGDLGLKPKHDPDPKPAKSRGSRKSGDDDSDRESRERDRFAELDASAEF